MTEVAIKRSKFSEAQIVFALKQTEDGTIGEVCRKAEISDARFYARRKKYDGRSAVSFIYVADSNDGEYYIVIADAAIGLSPAALATVRSRG